MRSRLLTIVVAVMTAGLGNVAGGAAPEVPPGGVVAWPGDGVSECSAFGRQWQPVLGRCWYAVDLLEAEGEVVLRRRAGDELEEAVVRVGAYPYPVQRLTVPERTVHLSDEDAARAKREAQRVAALWSSSGPARFTLPLAPPLEPLPEARSFGKRRFFNGEPRGPHTGVDFSAAPGTPVLAAATGTVVIAEEHFYAGNSVFVDHGDGLVTMYFHLTEIEVSQGEDVVRGQRLGTVGATGRVTGPHLHFGVRWHGARVDPGVLLGPVEAVPVVGE